MRKTNPPRKLFIFSLPSALLVAGAILAIRLALEVSHQTSLPELLRGTLLYWWVGLIYFPLGITGLVNPFYNTFDSVRADIEGYIIAGYALYLLITLIGTIRPNKPLLVYFWIILAANIIGCQMSFSLPM